MQMYKHIVQYYETDKMGITHHSNYVRWMEEARIDFLRQIGWDYKRLEDEGIISPVVAVDCQYKKSTTFSDEIAIKVNVAEYTGIRLKLNYEMTNQDGDKVFEGHSEHCFIDSEGKLIRIKKKYPEFNEALINLATQEE